MRRKNPISFHMGWGLWDQRVQGVEEERIFGSIFFDFMKMDEYINLCPRESDD